MRKNAEFDFIRTFVTFSRCFAPFLTIGAFFLPLWSSAGIARAERHKETSLPTRTPLALKSPVQDKNFYLLSLLENDPHARKILIGSEVLKKLLEKKRSLLSQSFAKDPPWDAIGVEELRFTNTEIAEVRQELARLYQADGEIKRLVEGPLRASGLYQKYSADSGEKLLAAAWQDCALGLNNILSVYGVGKSGLSSEIDSISYDPRSEFYIYLVHNLIGVLVDDASSQTLFFQPELKLALALLDANRRDEAGRFEPMEQGENRAAFRRVASISWNQYPYSVILVPGEGPDEPNVRLSPIGKLRLTLAVKRFREGKAPFLLVSGGYVHPKQTPYCEAYEMKQSLMRDFGIPENAIFIDPHARHTTTNLRNAARLIYRYGLPFEKTGLISTDTGQCDYIESKALQERCQRFLGYQPYEVLKRLSPFDLEFRPKLESLYADPGDPLDP